MTITIENSKITKPAINKQQAKIRVSAVGDKAFLVETLGDLNLSAQQKIWALSAQATQWQQVDEVILGMNNLLVILKTIPDNDEIFISQVTNLWDNLSERPINGKEVEVPVTYGGDHAFDLAALVDHSGLKDHEIIKLHYSATYRVFAVGSVPGFGYLYGLDPRIHMPRKKIPSLNMPKGCIIIGGMQTGVAMLTGPNGWNSIGFSEISMFDAHDNQPALLAPGDRVRFIPEIILL